MVFITYFYLYVLVTFNVLWLRIVCIVCSSYHIYCCSASYPVLFVIVLCLLWSVKGRQMQISCIATIW